MPAKIQALSLPNANVTRVRRVALVLSNRLQRNAVGATYSLANERGEKLALVSIAQHGLGSTHRAAARMALSSEMAGALRAASADYELSGEVLPETMNRMRLVLSAVDQA
ncbi:hypothetical protein SKZ59_07430 [Janthinobacterium sp. GMG2]|uniref:hypothetical protein n=1 Tax=Janthinobacterium sp. GMG2 TaxID=3096606 RepID=UPI0029F5A8E8|nr:hypothetical protein [Janthinobacterium sp. GMG2]MDX8121595.1 hypothetical protein [Janthinobacterium sp. GMG2]